MKKSQRERDHDDPGLFNRHRQSDFSIAGPGYKASSSDISAPMIDVANKKAADKHYDMDLHLADFRSLFRTFDNKLDCVISTENSLPHVSNADVKIAVEQMSAPVRPGGYI